MPRPQARCRGEAAKLEGTRELQRVFFAVERKEDCVCVVGVVAVDLRKPCLGPVLLRDCLATSVRKLYSWFLFFLFSFSLCPFTF